MQEDIKNTLFFRTKLRERILGELCKEWVRVIGTPGIAELDCDNLVREWNIPDRIMYRVIQEMVDDGLLECEDSWIRLTSRGRKECGKRKLD